MSWIDDHPASLASSAASGSAARRRRLVVAAFALAAVVGPASAHARSEASAASPTGADDSADAPDADPLAPLDDLMTSFVAERGLPGGVLAVARGGRLLYAQAVGVSDERRRDPLSPGARFRVASLSKPITAVMILALVDQGKLALDESAFARIAARLGLEDDAAGDPRLGEVTILQLLQHTGGFDRAASFDPMFRTAAIARDLGVTAPATADDVVRWLWRRPLDFPPGARFAYSNVGYCVLGRVIEAVCGEPYEDAVRHALLDPLGATSMRIGSSLSRAPGEVTYHVPEGRLVASVFPDRPPAPPPYGGWHQEAMDAHGGWIASAVDLLRFASALDEPPAAGAPRLLSSAARSRLFARPAYAAAGDGAEPVTYACGWNVRDVGRGRRNEWHLGQLEGTSTLLVRRHDGFRWVALFHGLGDAEPAPAVAIDPLIHRAVDAVSRWPVGEPLFEASAAGSSEGGADVRPRSDGGGGRGGGRGGGE